MASSPVVDKFLHAIEAATIPACQAWSTDAALDATVPNWRLQARGPDAIRAEYAPKGDTTHLVHVPRRLIGTTAPRAR